MDNEDLLNAGAGYVAGSSITRGIANNLRKQREEMEKKLAHITSEEVLSAEVAKFLLSEDRNGAYEYLTLILMRKLLVQHKIKQITYIP